jgi:hypothetical protein
MTDEEVEVYVEAFRPGGVSAFIADHPEDEQ